jgi:hypothetical protein
MFTEYDHQIMAQARVDLRSTKCEVCDQYFIEREKHLQEIADGADLAESLADDVRQARLDGDAWKAKFEAEKTKYRLALFAFVCIFIWAICHGPHGGVRN